MKSCHLSKNIQLQLNISTSARAHGVPTAIHRQGDAGGKRCVLGGQEGDRIGHFLSLPGPAKGVSLLASLQELYQYKNSIFIIACSFCGFKAQQCPGQRYGLKTLSTTRKPPFLAKFGLRLQVQAPGFQLTTPILEA